MEKIFRCVCLCIVLALFSGCGGIMKDAGLIKSTDSYLYKPGSTTKMMLSDRKACEFQSRGVDQNNQIVNNLGAAAARDIGNAASRESFMRACMEQKGYYFHNARYMERKVKNWDREFFRKSQDGFFFRKMDDDDITTDAKSGYTYYYLDANDNLIVIDEEYILKKTSYPWGLRTNKEGNIVDTSNWTLFSQPGR